MILLYCDTKSLLRLSQTQTYFRISAMQDCIWRKKLTHEWPGCNLKQEANAVDRDMELKMLMKYRSPYELYKIRWISIGQNNYEECVDTFHSILLEELLCSTKFIIQILVIPIKICGLITAPIFWLCRDGSTSRHSPSLACLRCNLFLLNSLVFITDLNIMAYSCFNFEHLHSFCILNMVCGVVYLLDCSSVLISKFFTIYFSFHFIFIETCVSSSTRKISKFLNVSRYLENQIESIWILFWMTTLVIFN
jgi:hypothetical protein